MTLVKFLFLNLFVHSLVVLLWKNIVVGKDVHAVKKFWIVFNGDLII